MNLKDKVVIVFDLDDTLYKEINFLKSAYKEIASYISIKTNGNINEIYFDLINYYQLEKNAFKEIILKHNLNLTVENLVQLYRNHIPDIRISDDTFNTLKELEYKGYKLGLLTDGRSIQQRNKIKKLQIERWFELIVISEEFGTEKPDLRNYLYFMEYYGEGDYYYIGDNINKDFVSPNKLGWISICLLDVNNINIHSQKSKVLPEFLPKYSITSITDLTTIIQS